jgi:hypothetical protein
LRSDQTDRNTDEAKRQIAGPESADGRRLDVGLRRRCRFAAARFAAARFVLARTLTLCRCSRWRCSRWRCSRWRGAYSIDDLHIEKRTGKVPVPLLDAPRTSLTVSWNALLKGAVVARVTFESPEISFVDAAGSESAQAGKGVNWREQLEGLLPIRRKKKYATRRVRSCERSASYGLAPCRCLIGN